MKIDLKNRTLSTETENNLQQFKKKNNLKSRMKMNEN